jgi:hypothetical protein
VDDAARAPQAASQGTSAFAAAGAINNEDDEGFGSGEWLFVQLLLLFLLPCLSVHCASEMGGFTRLQRLACSRLTTHEK